MAQQKYEVIVGNIGTVYYDTDKAEANRIFDIYVEQSKTGKGRAGGEDVTLFEDDEPSREYEGELSSQEEV